MIFPVPTIFGVWRRAETQYVDNSVENVENRDAADTGGRDPAPSIFHGGGQVLSGRGTILAGLGPLGWDLQEMTKKSTKNLAKS